MSFDDAFVIAYDKCTRHIFVPTPTTGGPFVQIILSAAYIWSVALLILLILDLGNIVRSIELLQLAHHQSCLDII